MDISFVLYGIPRAPSGGPKIIFEYANYLTTKGHKVNLLINLDPFFESYNLPNFAKKALKHIVLFTRPNWIKLDNRIKKIGFSSYDSKNIPDADVIIATDVRTAEPTAHLTLEKGMKFYLIQDFENWVVSDEEVYGTYDLGMINITVSQWLKTLIDSHSSSMSFCISNSINTAIFKVTKPLESRHRHSICFHYRSAPHKGCIYAVEVIEHLHQKYADLQVFVVSNEKKPDSIPNYVRFFQNISPVEVAEVNNNCSVFLCTSIKEGFGLPGLEAMACGCALVTTDYQGAMEYAEDMVNALISPVNDPDSLFTNVIRLFNDDILRLKLAKTGADMASHRSMDIVGEKFIRVLYSSLKSNI